jgi:hypothetical protein
MLSSLWPFCASAASLQQSSPSGCNPLGQSITCLCWGHPFPAAIRSEDPRQVGQSYGSCDRKDLERLHRQLPSGEQIRQTRRRCLSSRQPRGCATVRPPGETGAALFGEPALPLFLQEIISYRHGVRRRNPGVRRRGDGKNSGCRRPDPLQIGKSRWEGDARLRTMNPCLALRS